ARHRRRNPAAIGLSIGLALIVVAAIGAIVLATRPAPKATQVSAAVPSGSATATQTPTVGPTLSHTSAPTAKPSPHDGCVFAISEGVCPIAPPVTAAAGKRWTVSFDEEFNGTGYDHSKLTPCFDWNTGNCTSTFNDGREHYQPSQVVVSNGTAKLIA